MGSKSKVRRTVRATDHEGGEGSRPGVVKLCFTKQDFEAFKKEANRCIEILGLKGWKVYYDFVPLKGMYAQCSWNHTGRVATLILNSEPWSRGEAVESGPDPLDSARHEVGELLLAEITSMLSMLWCKGEVDRATHAVIRRLEKLLGQVGGCQHACGK